MQNAPREPLPGPFMGVVASGYHESGDNSIVYTATCLECGRQKTWAQWGDVASALDSFGWDPSGGWSRDDEPQGDGWLCPECGAKK